MHWILPSDKRLMRIFYVPLKHKYSRHSDTDDLNLVFNSFNIYLNNNQSKFMSLAYGLHNTITVTEKEDFPGISIVKFKKMVFSEKALNLIILYRGHSQTLTAFYEYLLYFIEAKSLGIIVGDCNIDACNQSKLSHLLAGYTQMVKSPTHIAGSIVDPVYVKGCYLKDHIIKFSVLNTYFSDHDAVRCTISKSEVHFTIL